MTRKRLTKKLLLTLLCGVLLATCTDEKKERKSEPKAEQGRIFGMYKDSLGKWTPALVMRVIQEGIKYDSATKTKTIAYDTLYGIDRLVNAFDSLGKPILDSLTKKQRLTLAPIRISPDSIMVKNIEGILIDSLAKRK